MNQASKSIDVLFLARSFVVAAVLILGWPALAQEPLEEPTGVEATKESPAGAEVTEPTSVTVSPDETTPSDGEGEVKVIDAASADSMEADSKPAEEPETTAEVEQAGAVISQVEEEKPAEIFPVTAQVQVGGAFSQVLSELGTSYTVSIGVGYLLPLLNEKLEAFGELAYQRPSSRGTIDDPRFELSDSYDYKIREEELLLSLGGRYRFFPPTTQLNFYGMAGWRWRFQRATTQGKSGWAGFGANHETDSKELGLVLGGGAEYVLLYGAVAAEPAFSVADLDHRVTGESTAGGLSLKVGYHFFF